MRVSHDNLGEDVFAALGLDMGSLTASGKSGQLIAWDDLSAHMASLLEGEEGDQEDDPYAEDRVEEEGEEEEEEEEEGKAGGDAPHVGGGAAAPAPTPAAARLQAGLPPAAGDSTYSVPVDEDDETSHGDIDESKVPDKRPSTSLGSSGGKARPQSAPRQRPASAQQQFAGGHRAPSHDPEVVDDDEEEEEEDIVVEEEEEEEGRGHQGRGHTVPFAGGAGASVEVDDVEEDGYDDEEFAVESPQRAAPGPKGPSGGFGGGAAGAAGAEEEEVEDDYGSDFD
jgi:hypothetical protein